MGQGFENTTIDDSNRVSDALPPLGDHVFEQANPLDNEIFDFNNEEKWASLQGVFVQQGFLGPANAGAEGFEFPAWKTGNGLYQFSDQTTLLAAKPENAFEWMNKQVQELSFDPAHPYRGHIDKTMDKIPDKNWQQAYDNFPQLKDSGLDRQQTIKLMQAIVRNELYHYNEKDGIDDAVAKFTGNAIDIPSRNAKQATLGVTQISPKGVQDMEREFPEQLSQYKGHEVQTLLNPSHAPNLVAANLAHNIDTYKRHGLEPNARNLAYGYNPRDKGPNGKSILLPDDTTLERSGHVKNVMHQLDIVTGKVKPIRGEN